jgi:hypothetical protein
LNADVAQSAERVLGKDEVTGSNPVIGSIRLAPEAMKSGATAQCLAVVRCVKRPATNEGGQFGLGQ